MKKIRITESQLDIVIKKRILEQDITADPHANDIDQTTIDEDPQVVFKNALWDIDAAEKKLATIVNDDQMDLLTRKLNELSIEIQQAYTDRYLLNQQSNIFPD